MKRSPLKRRTPMRKTNPKRRQSEFARCYHSKARVDFVKGLRCLLSSLAGNLSPCEGPTENAHTQTEGMGRKASYASIVPLCQKHHRAYDGHGFPFRTDISRGWVKDKAYTIELMWVR